MQYSEEFKAKVKSIYPDWQDLNNHLENGSEFVGRYLDDSSQGGLSPEEVMQAIDNQNVKALYEKAKTLAAKKALYGEWYDMYQEQRKPRGM